MEITVNRDRTNDFLKLVKRANLNYELKNTFTAKDTVYDRFFLDYTTIVKIFDVYEVEDYHFEGDPYKVLKRFDHVEKIVNTLKGEDTESNNEYLAKCKCDDCQRNIKTRRFSYLLENLNNHSKIQVGKSCMKKYFPLKIYNFYDTMIANNGYFDIDEEDMETDENLKYYELDYLLNLCVSRFIESKYDYDVYKYNFAMHPSENMDNDEFVKKTVELSDKIKNYVLNASGSNEWIRNLKTMVSNGWVSAKHLNLFRSIVCVYKNILKGNTCYNKKLDVGTTNVKIKKMIKNVTCYGEYGDYYKTHCVTDNDEYLVITTPTTKFYDTKEGSEVKVKIKFVSEFNGTVYNFGAVMSR